MTLTFKEALILTAVLGSILTLADIAFDVGHLAEPNPYEEILNE